MNSAWLVQKAAEKRERIITAYTKAQKAYSPYKTVGTLAQVKAALKAAEQAVPKKTWNSSTHCMNATVTKSINICKNVTAQRALLVKATEKAVLAQKLDLATEAVSKLDPLMAQTASPQLKAMIAVIFALCLEIGSSLFLPLAQIDFKKIMSVHHHSARRNNAQKGSTQPEEADWLKAMRAAAKDSTHAKIVFDEEGLLKAPYGALAEVWGVKSSSTAGQRLKKMVAQGYLEPLGSNSRNMRYKMLDMA